jgi:stage II sporulation protein R
MKKAIIAILTIFLLVQLIYGCNSYVSDPLRLHVVANSNSKEDQAVKLMVRDDLLSFTGEEMTDAQTRVQAEDYVLRHIGEITENANSVLRENGFDYGAEVSVGEFYFPEKKYGDTVYPAGMYRAVKIVLGSGSGDNWWCVIFPPLCIVAENDKKDDGSADKKDLNKGKITYKSIFADLFKDSKKN